MPQPFKQVVAPAAAAPALGPYSHAIRSGDLLFCSGQIPIRPDAPDAPLAADTAAQTEQVIANIRLLLADQGLDLSHVVKSTVFMIQLQDFARMNEVYARHFPAPYPARSTIQVAALPKGAAVEIEVIARFP